MDEKLEAILFDQLGTRITQITSGTPKILMDTRGIANEITGAGYRDLSEVIGMIDKSPAVLWAGKGGVKERLLAVLNVPE